MSEECASFLVEAEAEGKRGDHNLSAEKWKSGGFCYSDVGDFAKAADCFAKSAEESLKGKDKTGASGSLLYATVVLLRSGNQKEASNIVKLADTKGLGGTENMKLAKELVKATEAGKEEAKQKARHNFSHIIEDNYWLRKTLEKMGVTTSSS